MAYNKPGGRPRISSAGKGKAKPTKSKDKFSSSRDKDDSKGSEKKFRKPYSEKDRKPRSEGESGFSRFKRSGDDDKKGKYKKDDSFSKDKYSSSKDGDKKPRRSYGDKDKKFSSDKREGSSSYKRKDDSGFERKPKFEKDDSYRKNDKYKGDGEKRSYDKPRFDSEKKSYKSDGDKKPYRPFTKSYGDSTEKKRTYDKSFFDKGEKKSDSSDKPFKKRSNEFTEEKRFKHDDLEEGKAFKGHSKDKADFKEGKFRKNKFGKDNSSKSYKKDDDGTIRLNKYLAHAGISSRREADILIKGGTVKVNGVVVDQMGYKVRPDDVVTYADSTIKNERKVYLLLNKPKDFITTTDDPQERRTVMELVRPACKERIYPVGRLDRNTTGLLLFTNDGDMATKLMHPKHEIRKVYHVTLSKPLKGEDYKAISDGLELEDGPVKVDDIAYVGEGKKEVGLEIHNGRNRIVRRLFEHLGYEVLKLDRVSYAGLTKKDLPRGKYRFLSEKEISFLKMLG
jgi:23S rRNA pseudouridine2605 synthase